MGSSMNTRLVLLAGAAAALALTSVAANADPLPTGIVSDTCNQAANPYNPNDICNALRPPTPTDPPAYAQQQVDDTLSYVTSGNARYFVVHGLVDYALYGAYDTCVHDGRPAPTQACALVPTAAPID
jgi:hypothetical protein